MREEGLRKPKVSNTIKNDLEREIRMGYPFKIEVKSQFGTSIYTIRDVITLDDESIRFVDIKTNTSALRLDIVVRVFR